jgi:4-amino-4-deoxy-L-arabinose transferase-like glycosyltransferase
MGKLNRTLPLAILAGLCGLIIFLRLHTYDEPLERDLTTYAVIAHEMIGGKALYSDLWDHKPPAIHVTYAAAELVAGYGRDSIFLLNVAAAIATMVACYFAGTAAGSGPLGGLVAATLWALTSGDLALEGNQPNTEVFLNAFLTAGFAIFVCAPEKGLGWRRAMCAGLLFAVASLYKQIVIAQLAFLALAYFGVARTGSRKRAIVDLALVGAIGAGAWAMVFGYFALRGHVGAFVDAIFTYNRWYAGNGWQSFKQVTFWAPVFADVIAVIVPMATLALAGLGLGLALGRRRHWILLIALAVATHLVILSPGHFFPHYFQLWLPPLVVGAGWTIALMRRALPARLSWLCYVNAAVTAAVLIAMGIPYYKLPAESWSFRKYREIFIETDRLAAKLDRILPPGATLYEWGNETGFYFETRRQPPSGLTFSYPMQAGPLAAKLSRRVLDELQRGPPDVVVSVNPIWLLTTGHPVTRWLAKNYRPLWRTNSFTVRVRRGGLLDPDTPLAAR